MRRRLPGDLETMTLDGGSATRPRSSAFAGGPARSGAPRREPRRQAQDLRRRGARRRQDLRDAADGARQAAATATTSSSASSRPTAARRPRRCSTASRSFRAAASTTRASALEEMDLDAIIARRPQIALVDELAHTNAPGSRHPKRYLDVEELLQSRHRRLYDRQHPAHREPQRRRRADHARARARDRAGHHPRPRRRDRAGRPDAGRPDPAPEGRQGLRPQAGRARARALLLARQPHGAARAGAAPHRRTRRRAAAHADAGACHPGPVGGRRARPGLHQRGSARRRARPLRQARGRPPARARGRRSTSRRARSLQLCEERARPHRRYAAAGRERSAARPSPSRAATAASPTTSSAMRTATMSRRSSSANRRARAGSRSCTARSCTISCAGPATSAFMSSPVTSCRRARPARRRCAPRSGRASFDPRPYVDRAARRRGRARRRRADLSLVRHRERRPRVPDGDCRRGGAVRAVAVAAGQRRSVALL